MINNYVYILTTFVIIYLIRVLPLTFIRKPIKSIFIRSFLYYVPYVTLAVMTFPAIIHATSSLISGIAALVVGVLVALWKGDLLKVAASCCAVVFILEFFI